MNNSINTLSLFHSKCWFFTLEKHEEYKRLIKQIILMEENKKIHKIDTEYKRQSNIYAWRSSWFMHHLFPVCSEIVGEIRKKLPSIIEKEKYVIGDDQEFECVDSWINKYSKGDSALAHTHHHFGSLSSVYFVDVPPNSSDFYLYNDSFGGFESKLPENMYQLKVEVKEGTVLIFPGKMLHSVSENKNDQDRITFASNYELSFAEKDVRK
jgi:hypothetical protein